MAQTAAELTITLNGKDVGFAAAVKAAEDRLRAADAATKASETALRQYGDAQRRAADDTLRTAQSFARVDAASGNYADAVARLRVALDGEVAAGARVTNALQAQVIGYEKAAAAAASVKPPANVGGEFASSLKDGLIGVIGPAALASAALAGVATAAQAIADGLQLKAALDATSASLKIQLNGVRDINQVYDEGQAFATKYKLTQEELSGALSASTAILRTSKASTTDILNVLSELTVLAPGKSIQDAAFSVRELASGDIVSIADQFNISKVEAYKMRDAIAGGADAVTVLQGYLTGVGVNMDAVATKATGVGGALKDVKIAQEDVSLALGEFAANGLPAIGSIADAYRGLASVLRGDVSEGFEAAAQKVLALAGIQIAPDSAGLQTFGDVASAVFLAAADGAISAAEAQKIAALATNELSDAGTRSGAAWAEQTTGADATAVATAAATAAMVADVAAKQTATAATTELNALQATLGGLGGDVAAGLLTAANAATLLAQQYNLTFQEALKLISAQAALASGSGVVRLAAQKAQTRDLTGGRGVGLDAPGRRGASSDVAAFVAGQKALTASERTLAEAQGGRRAVIANLKSDLAGLTKGTAAYNLTAAKLVTAEQAAARGGGKGRKAGTGAADRAAAKELKAEERLEDKRTKLAKDAADDRAAIERDAAAERLKIAEDAAGKRADAERKYQLSQRRDRVSFYKSLADIEDPALRADASAQFEAIAAKSAEIAKTQGADAAAAYKEAATSALQAQTDIKQQIAQAEKDGDKGKAEYLRGILKLQEDADAEELAQIAAQGSAIAAEEESRYRDAEARYQAHLDEKARILAEKSAELGVNPADLGGTGQSAAPPAPPRGTASARTAPPPAIGGDAASIPAASAAASSDLGALLSAANDLASKANDLLGRIAAGTDKLKAGRPLTGEGV